MIELLNSRKMIAIVLILMAICLIIVILEGIVTDNESKPLPHARNPAVVDTNHNVENSSEKGNQQSADNSNCWLKEDFVVKGACSPCSQFEKVSKHLQACVDTGYKELIVCKSSGDTFRSCDIASRHFWYFELSMIMLSVIGTMLVNFRERQLNAKTLERLKRQLNCGV